MKLYFRMGAKLSDFSKSSKKIFTFLLRKYNKIGKKGVKTRKDEKKLGIIHFFR